MIWEHLFILSLSCFLVITEPPVSIRNPSAEGFPVVTRSGKAAPNTDKLCFTDKRKTVGTNDWWTPAILPIGPTGKNYVAQLPYIYNMVNSGMEVGYPWVLSSERIVQNIVNRYWTITSKGLNGYCLSNSDELTATFSWGTVLQSTLVRGSPYITTRFAHGSPRIYTQQGIRGFWVDDAPKKCNGSTVTGQKFRVHLRDSDESWVVYSPPGTSMTCKSDPSSFSLSKSSFSGVLRLALVNNCTTGMDGLSPHCPTKEVGNVAPEYAKALDSGSNVCTDGADVSSDRKLKGVQTIFNFRNSKCFPKLADGSLFLIALPHHMSLLCDNNVRIVPDGGHRNIRGYGTGILSDSGKWVMLLREQHIDWLGHPDHEKLPTIRRTLQQDKDFYLPWDMAAGMIDPYNAGKLLSKIARLVLIADQLGESQIASNLLFNLTRYSSAWLDHHTKNALLYDSSWGGIISCGCTYQWIDKKPKCINVHDDDSSKLECPTLTDPGMDFGNAFYNDHHFHYGYHIYAAAVIAKFDKDWAEQYNEKVMMLIRDIANPSYSDPYFSPYRYFDWFEGHSWAMGIISDPNGKNQESTSEAVNAWYGIHLYGVATQNQQLKVLGEVMLLSEIHSTNYYWHVVPHTQEIYPKKYEHTIVGIVHDMLVEFQTYFGLQGFFVHGIQLLPITPVVHLMFDPGWVQDAYPRFKDYCSAEPMCVESGFVTFLYAEQAMIDKETAWSNAMTLPDSVFTVDCAGGNGNSRTNTLYFISSWGNHPRPKWPNEMHLSQCPAGVPQTKAVETSGTNSSSTSWGGAILLTLCLVGGLALLLAAFAVARRLRGEESSNLLGSNNEQPHLPVTYRTA